MSMHSEGRMSVRTVAAWAAPCCLILVGAALYWVYGNHTSQANHPSSSAIASAPQPPASPHGNTAVGALSTTSIPSESGTYAGDPMLDDIRKEVLAEVEKNEDVRLAQFELRLRQQMASGWKPPWRGLDVQLTDDELRTLSTTELAVRLWATGIHARELIAFDRASFAMKRLEVCYRGFSELFNRPDLLDAIIAGIGMSSHLSPDRPDRDNLNLVMALTAVPQMYEYRPIRNTIVGHEQEVIDAHILALANIKTFVIAMSKRNTAAMITPRSAIVLSNAALALAERISPMEAQAARESLSHFPWKAANEVDDIARYIDQSVGILKAFTKLASARVARANA